MSRPGVTNSVVCGGKRRRKKKKEHYAVALRNPEGKRSRLSKQSSEKNRYFQKKKQKIIR